MPVPESKDVTNYPGPPERPRAQDIVAGLGDPPAMPNPATLISKSVTVAERVYGERSAAVTAVYHAVRSAAERVEAELGIEHAPGVPLMDWMHSALAEARRHMANLHLG